MLARLRTLPLRHLLLAALFLVGAFRYFTTEDVYGRRGGGVRLDGFYYYIYLHSIWYNGDLDLSNDYEEEGYDVRYPVVEATGRPQNPFAVGPAILWAPFLLLASLVVRIRIFLGETGLSLDPMSDLHQNLTLFGTYLYGCAAILLTYRILLGLFTRSTALLSSLAVALGGSLVYYMIACPSYAHAQSALALSGFVWAWLALDRGASPRRWILLGLFGGLALLLHAGNAPLLVLPLATAVRLVVHAARSRSARAVAAALLGPAAATLAAAVVFFPQALAWRVIYGRWLLTPQGEGFMRFGESEWLSTLFSPRQGLIPHAPLLGLALLGLLLLLPRRPALAGPALLALAALTFVNGAVYDFWGWGFGTRRFTAAFPLFALGLAALVERTGDFLARHRDRLPRLVPAVVVCLLVIVNLQFYRDFQKGNLDPVDPITTATTYRTVATGMINSLLSTVGNPLSFPQNWIFALEHGVEVDRFDTLHGLHLLDDNHEGANPHDLKKEDAINLGTDAGAVHLGPGFGKPGYFYGQRAVPVLEAGARARLLVPLNIRRGVRLVLKVRSVVAGTRLSVFWEGARLAETTLAGDWQMVETHVGRRLVRRGINHLEVEVVPPRGSEPARVCPLEVGRTGRRSPVPIAVAAAGQDAGDFADIWVGDERRGSNRRGLNLVTVDPSTGKVRDEAAFDVHATWSASRALRRFVEKLPRGTIVAVASRDEASRRFNKHAREALRRIGAAANLSEKWRHSYAAIGVVGAEEKTALEELRPERSRAHACVGRVPPPWRAVAHVERLSLFLD